MSRNPEGSQVTDSLKYIAFPNKTDRLHLFRDLIGTSNFDFNTIRAALDELAKNGVAPAVDYAVTWLPHDLPKAIDDAKAFSTKAFLVYAVDALDSIISKYPDEPSLIEDPAISSVIRGDLQYDQPQRKLTDAAIKKLRTNLDDRGLSIEAVVKDFQRYYLPKPRKTGVGERFTALSSCCPSLPKHYHAAVRILISWRNLSVHREATANVGSEIRNQWMSGLQDLSLTHPKSDSANLLIRYDAGEDPSPDDLTTMVALTHRALNEIDKHLIENADLEIYIRAALRVAIKSNPDKIKFVRNLWGISERSRAVKIMGLTMKFGLHRTTKKNLPKEARPIPDLFWLRLAKLPRDEFERIYL
jgi:hypothetical protein